MDQQVPVATELLSSVFYWGTYCFCWMCFALELLSDRQEWMSGLKPALFCHQYLQTWLAKSELWCVFVFLPFSAGLDRVSKLLLHPEGSQFCVFSVREDSFKLIWIVLPLCWLLSLCGSPRSQEVQFVKGSTSRSTLSLFWSCCGSFFY